MRLFVYPKDVMDLTGRSESYCRKIVRKVKKENGKSKQDQVTVQELATYLKTGEEEIRTSLKL